jgi:hypothetical protein
MTPKESDKGEATTSPGSDDLPSEVAAQIGVRRHEAEAEFPVEQGYIWTTCASVENGNPLFWNEDVAKELTGGSIAPLAMLSVWLRPHYWAPGREPGDAWSLLTHWELKTQLGLPEAIMTDDILTFYEPVRLGDRLKVCEILRSVSDVKTTKLGTGRFWTIDVEYSNQDGELVGVDTITGFGYRRPGQ